MSFSSPNSKINRDRNGPSKLKQAAIKNYVKRFDPQPSLRSKMQPKNTVQQSKKPIQQPKKPQQETRRKSLVGSNQNTKKGVLDGVIAFVDVWTDDDTNVSECCENILQDLGAMIRKSYTDTVTHLIFKNGSPTTFNKAKSKGKHIVNLLWVTHCQEKNERVPEDKYKISIAPQKLIGSKRRKTSMEPGRVKALFGNDGLLTNNGSSQEEVRRRTILTTDWVAKSLEGGKNKASSRESELRKRYIEELEKEEEEAGKEDSLARLKEENELVVLPPRLSLPVSAEMIANRHISKKRRSNINDIIPVEPPSKEAQEQIKARFSIGDKNVINSNSGTTNSNQNIIPTSFNQSVSSTSSTTATNSNNIIPVELPQIPQINNSGIRRRRLKVYTQATPSSPSSSSSRAIANNDKLQQPHSRQLQPQQQQQQPLALKVSIGRLPSSKAGNNRK